MGAGWGSTDKSFGGSNARAEAIGSRLEGPWITKIAALSRPAILETREERISIVIVDRNAFVPTIGALTTTWFMVMQFKTEPVGFSTHEHLSTAAHR